MTAAPWSAPIIRIQPTGPPRLDTPSPIFFGKPPACNRVLFAWWFTRERKPCEEAFLGSGSSGQ